MLHAYGKGIRNSEGLTFDSGQWRINQRSVEKKKKNSDFSIKKLFIINKFSYETNICCFLLFLGGR